MEQKSRTPKRVYFTKGFVMQGRQMTQWPSDKHKEVVCRVIEDRVQLLDPKKNELVEVPTSVAICVYDVAKVEAEESDG